MECPSSLSSPSPASLIDRVGDGILKVARVNMKAAIRGQIPFEAVRGKKYDVYSELLIKLCQLKNIASTMRVRMDATFTQKHTAEHLAVALQLSKTAYYIFLREIGLSPDDLCDDPDVLLQKSKHLWPIVAPYMKDQTEERDRMPDYMI